MLSDRHRRRFDLVTVLPHGGLPDASRLLPRVTAGWRRDNDAGCTRMAAPMRYRRVKPGLCTKEANDEALEMPRNLQTAFSNPLWHSTSPPNLEKMLLHQFTVFFH